MPARWGRAARDENLCAGPSATPALDPAGELLYTLSSDGDLNCWDTREAGRRVWGLNLYNTHAVTQRPDAGGGVRDYGYTTSPLVYGNWVSLQSGHPRWACLPGLAAASLRGPGDRQVPLGRRFGDDGSCLVTSDGRLVVCGNEALALAETEPRAGGQLYARDAQGNLLCFTLVP